MLLAILACSGRRGSRSRESSRWRRSWRPSRRGSSSSCSPGIALGICCGIGRRGSRWGARSSASVLWLLLPTRPSPTSFTPKEMSSRPTARVCPSSPLALLGVRGRTSAYYAGGQPQTLNDTASAYAWLAASGGQRRCLALKAEELAQLNQLWREKSRSRGLNVLVLGRAFRVQILLAGVDRRVGRNKPENPLASLVTDEPPASAAHDRRQHGRQAPGPRRGSRRRAREASRRRGARADLPSENLLPGPTTPVTTGSGSLYPHRRCPVLLQQGPLSR